MPIDFIIENKQKRTLLCVFRLKKFKVADNESKNIHFMRGSVTKNLESRIINI